MGEQVVRSEDPRMELAVGMLCAPRDGHVYVDRSLASLRAAGFREQLHLFCEPGAPVAACNTAENVMLHLNTERLNCYGNFRHGLTWLIENTNADWLLMLQDDVIWRAKAYHRMRTSFERWGAPEEKVGVLSPYCSRAMAGVRIRFRKREVWHDAIFLRGTFWGALALCFPRRAAEMMVSHPVFLSHTSPRKVDVLVGDVMRKELGLRVLVHAPSLADHIGAYSSLGRHRIEGISWARNGLWFAEGT